MVDVTLHVDVGGTVKVERGLSSLLLQCYLNKLKDVCPEYQHGNSYTAPKHQLNISTLLEEARS